MFRTGNYPPQDMRSHNACYLIYDSSLLCRKGNSKPPNDEHQTPHLKCICGNFAHSASTNFHCIFKAQTKVSVCTCTIVWKELNTMACIRLRSSHATICSVATDWETKRSCMTRTKEPQVADPGNRKSIIQRSNHRSWGGMAGRAIQANAPRDGSMKW